MQQTTAVWRSIAVIHRTVFLDEIEPLCRKKTTELAAVAEAGISNYHLGSRCSMSFNHAREQQRLIAFVKHVAGNDQLEIPKGGLRYVPGQALVAQRWQGVVRGVVGQEGIG
jgi:hypothetical protein